MSTVHDHPATAGPAQPQEYTPWAAGGAPGGPGWPGGEGGGPGGPSGRPRHRLFAWMAGLVAVVAAAAVASVAAIRVSAATPQNTVLTTSQIAATVDPALVNINSTLGYEHAASAGTGMVISPSGIVLTNNHVVEGATSIRATDIGNGRTYRATVIGYDKSHDVAVLKLQDASGLKAVNLGDSSSVKAGQKVVALGNAGGRGGTPSVAPGHVTGVNQSIQASDESAATTENLTGMIRTNAAIVAGDSGGPLANTAGQVVGINTAGNSSTFHVNSNVQGFAIPIDRAESITGQILAHKGSGTVHIGATAFLGIGVAQQAAGGPSGATIAGVLPGTPAAQAGLSAGDVITSVGGRSVTSPDTLQTVMLSHHPRDQVTVTWIDQSGQTHSATLTLASGPVA
jgi:S1-C subfamily serine protease